MELLHKELDLPQPGGELRQLTALMVRQLRELAGQTVPGHKKYMGLVSWGGTGEDEISMQKSFCLVRK